MIRVQMGGDHPGDWLAIQVISKDFLPTFLHILTIQAGVDDGPSIIVTQQPYIDMVEAAPHWHTGPVDTICNFSDFTVFRQLALKPVLQRVESPL